MNQRETDGLPPRQCRLGWQTQSGHRVLLELLSHDTQNVEFMVLRPETERPDPYWRYRMNEQDVQRAEAAFRGLLRKMAPEPEEEPLPEVESVGAAPAQKMRLRAF